MYVNKIEQTLFDAATPVAITSSTDATPIVVTATAHGFLTGQRVLIYGHTTNIAANGIYLVGVVTTNTFSLLDEITGASVTGSGAGAGSSGICILAPAVMLVSDFRNLVVQIGTTGTATMTLKMAFSAGKSFQYSRHDNTPRYDYPNMGGTVSPANPYSFAQLIDLDTGAAINGSTGIVIAGTDIDKQYEVNTNLMKYFTIIPISWSAGVITAKAIAVTNV